MKPTTQLWKDWWNSRSSDISSDYELDRISSFRNMEMERLSEKKLLDFIAPKPSHFVFDAGCGTGTNLQRLTSRVNDIIGMDFAEGIIDRCKARILREGISNSALLVGSLSNIGLKCSVFDMIVCMSVLHYLDDEECQSAMRELVRIAKDDAVLILHVKNLSSLYCSTLYLAKRIKAIFTKKPVMEHFRPFGWYKKTLSRLGAEIVAYDSDSIFLIDFLPRTLVQWMRAMEMKYYRSRFLRKYGAELKIRARITKAGEMTM